MTDTTAAETADRVAGDNVDRAVAGPLEAVLMVADQPLDAIDLARRWTLPLPRWCAP